MPHTLRDSLNALTRLRFAKHPPTTRLRSLGGGIRARAFKRDGKVSISKRPASRRLFYCFAAAGCCHCVGVIQQTVDGLQGTLEILPRSSYVPSAKIGGWSQ